MARLVKHLVEAPRACSYLPDTVASLEHRLMLDVGPDELDRLLERGWRRFGPDYFRPACPSCSKCIPTRLPVSTFSPTKSQRRARRKATGLRIMVGPPVVDDEHLDLYHRWHADREVAREWSPSALDAREYSLQFAFPHPSGREVSFHDDEEGGRLVGVGLCDEAPRAWSLVYFFYDPAYAERSLGVANVVIGMEIAAMKRIPYVYLGYNVEGCASLRYKGAFGPREELQGWPAPGEAPVWVRVG
jgi:arginyl-tRNA--protein-N-Asp/Glu arginylyltransferase